MTDSPLPGLLVAAIGGAGIGVERQQSGHASGQNARFAGIRTFTLIGIVSGIAGWLAREEQQLIALALVSGVVALVVVAYAAASRRDVEATTEVAAFVAIAAGLLSGLGFTTLASGIIAVTVLLLVEKSRLHRLVERLDDRELRAAARFGVMAVVVLPLLPEGPFGPLGGVRPRELWLLVIFFTGLSFVGYFARRIVGATHGYPLTGALAGIVSSTNATFTFARLSREHFAPSGTLATGAIAACTVLFPRVLIATTVLDARVARALVPYLVPPFVLGLMLVTFWLRSARERPPASTQAGNPLQVWPALQMALTFQLVLYAVAVVRGWFGAGGLLATGAVLGLTDVDALTISMTKAASTGLEPATAATAIAIGILANCVMKAAIAITLGTREFSTRTAGALAMMAIAIVVVMGALA